MENYWLYDWIFNTVNNSTEKLEPGQRDRRNEQHIEDELQKMKDTLHTWMSNLISLKKSQFIMEKIFKEQILKVMRES